MDDRNRVLYRVECHLLAQMTADIGEETINALSDAANIVNYLHDGELFWPHHPLGKPVTASCRFGPHK